MTRLCTFLLPAPAGSDERPSLCPQPALKGSSAQLCRHHAAQPRLNEKKAQAAAEAARLPLRRRLRAEHELRLRLAEADQHFRAQQLRLHPLPDFDSLPNLHLALDRILHLHAVGVFDARTTRILLRPLRICFASLQLGYSDPAAAAFRARLREANRTLASSASSAVSIRPSSASISVPQRLQSNPSHIPLPSSPFALQFAPLSDSQQTEPSQ